MNGLRAFTRHSFPKSRRKTSTTALCCFIKEGKARNKKPKPEATHLRMLTHRPRIRRLKQSEQLKQLWPWASVHAAKWFWNDRNRTHNFCTFELNIIAGSLHIHIVWPQNICLFCSKQKEVWPSTGKHVKTLVLRAESRNLGTEILGKVWPDRAKQRFNGSTELLSNSKRSKTSQLNQSRFCSLKPKPYVLSLHRGVGIYIPAHPGSGNISTKQFEC